MKYIVSITALLTVVLLILLNLRGCSNTDGWTTLQTQLVRIDTVRLTLPAPPPVRDTVQGDTLIIYRDSVQDSALLASAHETQRQYDSLKAVLAEYAERIAFTKEDIIASTGDTIRIECNELDRSILYSLRYAPRLASIKQPTFNLPLQQSTVHQAFGLGVCLGAGLNTEGQFRLTLSVGILYGYFIE